MPSGWLSGQAVATLLSSLHTIYNVPGIILYLIVFPSSFSPNRGGKTLEGYLSTCSTLLLQVPVYALITGNSFLGTNYLELV